MKLKRSPSTNTSGPSDVELEVAWLAGIWEGEGCPGQL